MVGLEKGVKWAFLDEIDSICVLKLSLDFEELLVEGLAAQLVDLPNVVFRVFCFDYLNEKFHAWIKKIRGSSGFFYLLCRILII